MSSIGSTVYVHISDVAVSRCNKTQPHKFVNEIMASIYSEYFMTCYSLGGTSSKESTKSSLPADDVLQILVGILVCC